MSETQEKSSSDSANENILEKLQAALRSDGDFPVRAKVVTELRKLVNDPNTAISQVTEVILKEPSLGTRVLSLVNSSLYASSQPIMTITQAVNRLGMKPLSNLCSGFVLMNRFVPAAKRGGIFSDSLRDSILISIISSYIAKNSKEKGASEQAYLAGTFYNLGQLLLAFYFPQVFESAGRRAKVKKISVKQSLTEILGVSPSDISFTIVDALEIPDFYQAVISETHKSYEECDKSSKAFALANALRTAIHISEYINHCTSVDMLTEKTLALSEKSGYSTELLNSLVDDIQQIFSEHCRLIELSFLSLPEYIITGKATASIDKQTEEAISQFSSYTDEIKEAIEDGEPLSSVLTSAMETLAFGLQFERVILLMADSETEELRYKMHLGKPANDNLRKLTRYTNSPELSNAPDVRAFLDGAIKTIGEQVFQDGWPFVAIPVGGINSNAVGVIYADMISLPDDDMPPLDNRTLASLSILVELLDQAVSAP